MRQVAEVYENQKDRVSEESKENKDEKRGFNNFNIDGYLMTLEKVWSERQR